MNYTELTLENLKEISCDAAEEISKETSIDLIVYVAKAGFPIAEYMNQVFKVDILGIGAQRKGNFLKEKLGPLLVHCPRFIRDMLITIELKTKVHKRDSERNINFHLSINDMNTQSYENILIVDDSVDTGNSMKMVYNEVIKTFPHANIYSYSLNVWKTSREVFDTNYCTYENTVIKAPMSKDSNEYNEFISMYNKMTMNGYL